MAAFFARRFGLSAILCAVMLAASAKAAPTSAAFVAYLQRYVATNNFSGAVIVTQHGKVVFRRAYGMADMAAHISNTPDTQFHVASLSAQFTVAAAMRLVEDGKLRLDTKVSEVVPSFPNGDQITLRHLLTETSGIADINALPNYNDVLSHHQTPETLVAQVVGKPRRFGPGGKHTGEEHSAYNLLALIIERTMGRPFRAAIEQEVFAPLGMTNSGVDDDAVTGGHFARGYMPKGIMDLQPAPALMWSAKAGNGSAYSTVDDEVKWLDAFFADRFLSRGSREMMLDMSVGHAGFGWFKSASERFGETAYYANGRSPGFASYLIHLPAEDISVVVLGNIYASSTTQIGLDLAAIAAGKPYEPLNLRPEKWTAAQAARMEGTFHFSADFYQPNAAVALTVQEGDLYLRWPNGDLSPLVPVGKDAFIDRAYWEPVAVSRGPDGTVRSLRYDRFDGSR